MLPRTREIRRSGLMHLDSTRSACLSPDPAFLRRSSAPSECTCQEPLSWCVEATCRCFATSFKMAARLPSMLLRRMRESRRRTTLIKLLPSKSKKSSMTPHPLRRLPSSSSRRKSRTSLRTMTRQSGMMMELRETEVIQFRGLTLLFTF